VSAAAGTFAERGPSQTTTVALFSQAMSAMADAGAAATAPARDGAGLDRFPRLFTPGHSLA
jgi:hypothetical protein